MYFLAPHAWADLRSGGKPALPLLLLSDHNHHVNCFVTVWDVHGTEEKRRSNWCLFSRW